MKEKHPASVYISLTISGDNAMKVSPKKINKLISRLQNFVTRLNGHTDLHVYRKIDQFYYMQKMEELKILKSQSEEAQGKLQDIHTRIFMHYHEIACKWSKDVRWVNMQVRNPKYYKLNKKNWI